MACEWSGVAGLLFLTAASKEHGRHKGEKKAQPAGTRERAAVGAAEGVKRGAKASLQLYCEHYLGLGRPSRLRTRPCIGDARGWEDGRGCWGSAVRLCLGCTQPLFAFAFWGHGIAIGIARRRAERPSTGRDLRAES